MPLDATTLQAHRHVKKEDAFRTGNLFNYCTRDRGKGTVEQFVHTTMTNMPWESNYRKSTEKVQTGTKKKGNGWQKMDTDYTQYRAIKKHRLGEDMVIGNRTPYTHTCCTSEVTPRTWPEGSIHKKGKPNEV